MARIKKKKIALKTDLLNYLLKIKERGKGKIDFLATGDINYTRKTDIVQRDGTREELNKTEKKPFINSLESDWYYWMICPICQCRLRSDSKWIYCSKSDCGYYEVKILLDSIVRKFYTNIRVLSGDNGISSPGALKINW